MPDVTWAPFFHVEVADDCHWKLTLCVTDDGLDTFHLDGINDLPVLVTAVLHLAADNVQVVRVQLVWGHG